MSVGAVMRVELAGLVDPVLLGAALPGDGGGGGEADRPQRAGPEGVDLVVGHLQDVDEHGDDGGVVVASGQRRLDALDRAGRVGEAEARFVEDEVVDVAGQGGGAHGAVGAVGVAPQGDGSAGAGGDGVDDGGDVVEVAFDRVVGGVAAGAEPSAVHRSRW